MTKEATLDEVVDLVKDAVGKTEELQRKAADQHKDIDGRVAKISDEIARIGKENGETKEAFQASVEKVERLESDLDAAVNKLARVLDVGKAANEASLLQKVEEGCPNLKGYTGGNAKVLDWNGSLFRKAVTSGSGSAGPALDPYRVPGIMLDPDQPLTVRDLLTTVAIMQASIEWVKELGFTNSAAVQATEGAAKAESDITFERQSTPVVTLAHWIRASNQILADVPTMMDLITGKLRYGLKYVEEQQILYGTGTGGNLHGIMPQATTYDATGDPAGDTNIDRIRRAILDVNRALYPADSVVLAPEGWADIELTKTTEGAYVFANPANPTQPRLWGKRVIEAYSFAADEFLTGSFRFGATLYDREQTSVRVSEHHANFFVENMTAVLVEERVALAVERPEAFVTGTFG